MRLACTIFVILLLMVNGVIYDDKNICKDVVLYAILLGFLIDVMDSRVLRISFFLFYGMQILLIIWCPLLQTILGAC